MWQTHNVALVAPIADFIVSIGSNGTVKSQTQDLSVALAKDPKLAAAVKRDEEVLEAGGEEVAPPAAATATGQGKLILAEEVAQGHVSWKSIKLLIDGMGGTHPIRFFAIVLATLMLNEWSITFQVWYMGYWGSQYEKHPPSEVNVVKYVANFLMALFATNFGPDTSPLIRPSSSARSRFTCSPISTTSGDLSGLRGISTTGLSTPCLAVH